MSNAVKIELHDDVALVRINNPPVNALSTEVRAGLLDAVVQTDADSTIRGVVLVCEGRTFIAGADIKEFGKPPAPPSLPTVIDAIECAKKPWVACIHGSALGGGLEVTLGCHFRISNNGARFGFPEVNIGLIPGAGGTVRLPRLIPMKDAINLITSGKPINAERALGVGLIDKITNDDLVSTAIQIVAANTLSEPMPIPISERDINGVLPKDALESLRTTVVKRARGQLSPVVAFDTVVNGTQLITEKAFKLEREQFLALKKSEQSTALRYYFFAERKATKLTPSVQVAPEEITCTGIVGGGTMGCGIAVASLLGGFDTVLVETSPESTKKAYDTIASTLDASVKRKLITDKQQADFIENKLSCSTDMGRLCNADIVIEAVFEDMAVKKSVFKELEKVVRHDTLLASNSSYLDLNELANACQNPSRVFGLHFFSPAHIMKLVEIVRTELMSERNLISAHAFAKKLNKLPIVAGVCDGFIGNRIMAKYRQAAEYMLEDGALPFEVDAAMKSYGFPMGLFEVQDLAGLDIAYAMRKRRATSRSSDERYVDIPDKLVEMGRLGRKTSGGYYQYDSTATPNRDDSVEALIVAESKRKNIQRRQWSCDEIINTLVTAMQTEAKLILQEGIADSPEAIDVVMVNGYGFPRWRGGPMHLLTT